MIYTEIMGLFWNWKKQTTATPASPQPEVQKKEKPLQHTVPSGDTKPRPQPEQHAQPIHKEAAPIDHAKPQPEIEMRKFVFRLSSHDSEKCNAFIKNILHKVNRHDWHTLSGRIGKHSDGIKMRMDIKGKHEDIQSFIQWCKVDHLGVHAYEVIESKAYSMPYSGFPPLQEQKMHWPTS